MLSGTLILEQVTIGFSDPNVLLIAALFVFSEGLVRTGIAYQVSYWLVGVAGNNENKMLIFLMITVAGLGAFMSSTGIVAIFIPVVLNVAKQMKISPSTLDNAVKFYRTYQWHDDVSGDTTKYDCQ